NNHFKGLCDAAAFGWIGYGELAKVTRIGEFSPLSGLPGDAEFGERIAVVDNAVCRKHGSIPAALHIVESFPRDFLWDGGRDRAGFGSVDKPIRMTFKQTAIHEHAA